MDKDLGELSRGDDELGNEVHGVITVATKLGRGFLIRSELAVELRTVMVLRSFVEGEQGVFQLT